LFVPRGAPWTARRSLLEELVGDELEAEEERDIAGKKSVAGFGAVQRRLDVSRALHRVRRAAGGACALVKRRGWGCG